MLDVIAPTSDDVVFAAGYATACAAIATLEFLAAFHICTHHAHRQLHRTAWIFAFSAGITWLCAATTLLAERLAPVIAAAFVVFAALMFGYARRFTARRTRPGIAWTTTRDGHPRPFRVYHMNQDQLRQHVTAQAVAQRGLRYTPLSLAAALTRGEYRHLPGGRLRVCCAACGQLVDTGAFPLPEHGCIPTPDPDLED